MIVYSEYTLRKLTGVAWQCLRVYAVKRSSDITIHMITSHAVRCREEEVIQPNCPPISRNYENCTGLARLQGAFRPLAASVPSRVLRGTAD